MNETRIEPRHKKVIFSESGSSENAVLEAARHQECGGEQHEGYGDLRYHQEIAAEQAFATRYIHFAGFEVRLRGLCVCFVRQARGRRQRRSEWTGRA